MNLRILGKAMGFMFLPTLGVLLLLIVGFFDPIAMWHWIKSDNDWAILVRIVIFLLEIGLVVVMYFYYLNQHFEEIKRKVRQDKQVLSDRRISYETSTYNLFAYFLGSFSKDGYSYIVGNTESPDILILERKTKTD